MPIEKAPLLSKEYLDLKAICTVLMLTLLWASTIPPSEEMQVLLRMDFASEFCGPTPKKQRQWREPGTSSDLTLGGGWGEGHLWKSSRSDQGDF